jgi:hypothetical protein
MPLTVVVPQALDPVTPLALPLLHWVPRLISPFLMMFLYRSMKRYLTAAGTLDLVQHNPWPSADYESGDASYRA